MVEINDLQVANFLLTKIEGLKLQCLCDCSDAYIVVKAIMTVEGDNKAKKRNKKLTFTNNVPFRSCISKINNTFIDNAENLDIVRSMYNLL